MITGTLSTKGQVTIPKQIRELLKTGPNDKIVFIPLEDGTVLITNEKQKPASALFGMLKHRQLAKPVSVEDMDAVIRRKRIARRGK